jgi:hypothetical protein
MRLKKKKSVFPGPHVGEASSKDDALPIQKFLRGETTKHAQRGRTEPRRGATPPKHHGPK